MTELGFLACPLYMLNIPVSLFYHWARVLYEYLLYCFPLPFMYLRYEAHIDLIILVPDTETERHA